MANEKQYEIIKKSVYKWNKWRTENGDAIIDLNKANFFREYLNTASLSNANLIGANFNNAKLRGADLSNANLEGANLFFADLRGADLRDANLAGTDLSNANLSNANLSNAKIYDSNLSRVNLSNANLSNAILGGCSFSNADLSNANLSNASLRHANLYEANLSEANLSDVNLLNTSFVSTNLDNVSFRNCFLHKTVFGLTDLSKIKELNTVRVSTECSIDFQTLRNSRNIPKEFLLKIGLPENYINYLPDFYDESPLRLFPVFLSHSSANKEFAGKLYDALIKKGVLVWYDEKKLRAGDEIFEELTKAIDVYDKMILVCSKESLEESWWVDEEINRIFKKERTYLKEKKKNVSLLIPITIDDHIFKWEGAKGESIRDKVIGDFSEWEDDVKFEKALNELIEALNVDREQNERKPLSFLDGPK